jgi:hypothetical protein
MVGLANPIAAKHLGTAQDWRKPGSWGLSYAGGAYWTALTAKEEALTNAARG